MPFYQRREVAKIKARVRRSVLPYYSIAIITVSLVGLISISANFVYPADDLEHHILHREKRSLISNGTNSTTEQSFIGTTFPYIGDYPKEIFTLKQLRQGAVILHTIGMIYMFIALAIVCDEFFVPSIEVLTEVFGLTEDVSGATFMAAGGSAPEFFSSIAGLFLSKNSVGISTIIGSAVFNILFVIGMCALFARETLTLTWWPLFRDSMFYSVSLIVLIVSFLDWKIHYYEALVLIFCYISYVTFMYFNSSIEKGVKASCCKCCRTTPDNALNVRAAAMMQTGSTPDDAEGMTFITQPSQSVTTGLPKKYSIFRAGLLQLMISTIDPLAEGKLEERAARLQAIATHPIREASVDENGSIRSGPDQNGNKSGVNPTSNLNAGQQKQTNGKVKSADLTASTEVNNSQSDAAAIELLERNGSAANNDQLDVETVAPGHHEVDDGDNSDPLDISWPKTMRKRISYVLLAPIIFPLWVTLPDPRRQNRRKFWPITFFGSILWIAFFSIMMVWWASVICVAIGMPVQVIGLTVLAAGTSVPDLLTSVIVARKGYGDMAISSSIGSNLFDITVGLPIPWLIGSLIALPTGGFVSVDAAGLLCSIILLFCMLLVVISSIAVFKWRMSKPMGVVYLLLYFVFVAFSVLLAYEIIPCIDLI